MNIWQCIGPVTTKCCRQFAFWLISSKMLILRRKSICTWRAFNTIISIKEGRTVEWLQSRKGKNLDQCIHLVRFVLSNSAQGTIVGSAGPLETKETSQKDLRSLNLKEVAMRVVLCKLVRGEEDGEMLAKRQAAYLSAFCQAEQDRDPGDVDEMKQALGSRTKMERKALRAQKLIERAGANHDLRQKVTACVPLV